MTSQLTAPAATSTRPTTKPAYAGFGTVLKDWLLRTGHGQKELAHALHVDPSTVTNWVHGQKRPDGTSLIKMVATFRSWFGREWTPLEALDAFACLGYDREKLSEVAARHFQLGGLASLPRPG